MNKTPESKSWHTQETQTVFEAFKTTENGLSREDAVQRLAEHGRNRLPEAKTHGPLIRFLYQFHNLLIYVLIAASVVTAMLGHWVDTSVILGVVFLNAVIGFIQEGKAEDALKAIRQMLSLNAIVLRDGRQRTIEAEELVPGDIVLLQSGDKVHVKSLDEIRATLDENGRTEGCTFIYSEMAKHCGKTAEDLAGEI